MSYLGIDIGSSQVKAVVRSAAGTELATAKRQYATMVPAENFAELDSREVLAKAFEVIREVALQLQGDPIQALAVSSQGEAFTPVDAAGEMLGNAMISSDLRAVDEIAAFAGLIDVQRLYQITGHTPAAMFTLYKILWLKRHRRAIFDRTAKFLCFEDLLAARLGVVPTMGFPLAGRTMLFDVCRGEWSREVCDAVGIRVDQLAQALPSGTLVGVIPEAVAESLGLTGEVWWVTGGHDQSVGALGCGAYQAGQSMYAAGSVECIAPVFDAATLNPRLAAANLCCYHSCLAGQYTTVAYSLTGSNLLQYFMENYCRDLAMDAGQGHGNPYRKLIAELPAAPTNLLVLPYFTPSGTPFFDAVTPGVVYGWRLNTSRGELLKGLLEGIAFEMRRNLEILDESGIVVKELICSGGGNRDIELVQLKSNILNRPIKVIEIREAGCRGAALLAQSAVTRCPVPLLPCAMPPETAIVQPDGEAARIYDRNYRKWKAFTAAQFQLARSWDA